MSHLNTLDFDVGPDWADSFRPIHLGKKIETQTTGFVDETLEPEATTTKVLREIRGSASGKVASVVGALAIVAVGAGAIVARMNQEIKMPEASYNEKWAKQDPLNLPKAPLAAMAKVPVVDDIRDRESADQRKERVMRARIRFLMGTHDSKTDLSDEEILTLKDEKLDTEERRWSLLRGGYMNTYPTYIFKMIMAEPLPIKGRAAAIALQLEEIFVKKVANNPDHLKEQFPDAQSPEEVVRLFLQSIPRWRNEAFTHETIQAFANGYPKYILENPGILKGLFTTDERSYMIYLAASKCPHEAKKALNAFEENSSNKFKLNDHFKGIIGGGTANSLYITAINNSSLFHDCDK